MVQDVAATTNFNFDEIFHMPAQDFFTYISFINERNRKEYLRQLKEANEMKARMRAKK